MIGNKQKKRGDCEFLLSDNTIACKWMDNQSVLHLSSAFEGMNNILPVLIREKGSKTKSSVSCPKDVKLDNSGMGGVDPMDQRTAAYRLDRKSSVRFYLRIFFDLMDIACVNSYLIYNMKHPNKFSLLDYKIDVAKNLIQYHQDWKPFSSTNVEAIEEEKANLNRLIIMEDIYQIAKRGENDENR